MKPVQPENWKIDVGFKNKLQPEEAKFIFEEAEKAFNDAIETSAKILDRNSSLLQLVAGILVGLVAYAIGKWEKSGYLDSLLITAVSGIVYFFCLGLFFIFPNIKPTEYILPGTQPKKLFIEPIFDTPDASRCLLLYMIKITNLQEAITFNREINNRRWKFYRRSLNFLFYSPIILIIIYLLSNWLSK
ncbi:hypothetical protein [Mucilaginibacter xinganensis]|uniref:Uncharacterized protein n=1 Tax=Mucilaginibacter xinganensis TaxID=1234841 RepID=A0A223NUP3_9SPHI|nr:hypothetical protein [Mucilaginibacter xinganensis]ASU33602.1 hypothetical protein MuYL_1706 [Mucilaginibacter xinganensis]